MSSKRPMRGCGRFSANTSRVGSPRRSSPIAVLLRPTETVATILYSDIQGFTGIVERMAPERLIEMLNEYFPAVIEPIDRNGGIVNQFLGDAMLVTFNIPIADPEHAEKALRTAIEIQARRSAAAHSPASNS